MAQHPDILCIGSVLWDIIGRTPSVMRVGSDVPGRITRLPGGVAMNIAMTLARFGLTPALLTTIGKDEEGTDLLRACTARGLITDLIHLSEDLPTDRYMAIEGANGLIAAIADAHSLEAAGDKILAPLRDGRLPKPYRGPVALDGNLTVELLAEIATSDLFAEAALHVAPASPGKADRLLPFLQAGRGTLYVNLEEAGLLCQTAFSTAEQAAKALLARGAARALVTDGGNPACLASAAETITAEPPQVLVQRVTGAGDMFMAAFIAAEERGQAPQAALSRALHAAATYVSGETPS
jgi:sugar/nucleoside kinase (ribokinase family)